MTLNPEFITIRSAFTEGDTQERDLLKKAIIDLLISKIKETKDVGSVVSLCVEVVVFTREELEAYVIERLANHDK